MKPIYVTKPSLAPLPEYVEYLEKIWQSGVMTHNGPLIQQLEQELASYLRVPHVVCVANGTCALQLSLRALEVTGEVITTPFTYIATANIIAWERCQPVFADVDPATWNLDPEQVEARVTDRTTAIMPVHVFSAPCELDAIEDIARRRGLRVIYDAAHAMAVDHDGRSVLIRGDVSAVSFHATKLFNTGEGGACITGDPDLAERLRRLRFFGFDDAKDVVDLGMNAKMTEVAAGLGLANLPHLDRVRARRRELYEAYVERLEPAARFRFQRFDPASYNYSYMPVLFESEEVLLRVEQRLQAISVFPRRYFYPSLNCLEIFGPAPSLPRCQEIARTILCLPLYDDLGIEDIDRVCATILAA